MTELHEAFRRWLIRGHRDAVPRDVGLHAAGCPDCTLAASAFDALERIAPSAAPEPPLVLGTSTARRAGTSIRRYAAAGATVAAAVLVALIAAANLPMTPGGIVQATESERGTPIAVGTPGGAILAGVPTPEASLEPTDEPDGSTGAEPEATGSPRGAAAAVPPWRGGPTPGTPIPSGRPGASRSPAPSPTPVSSVDPTPVPPTLAPTPTPIPSPEPTPLPTPVPAACANGVDDDGDVLVDLEDPGCEGSADDSEDP